MNRYAATVSLVVLIAPNLARAHALERIDVCATDLAQVATAVQNVGERYIKQQRALFKKRSTTAHIEKHMDRWISILRASRTNDQCTLEQKARLMQFQFDLERLLD